MLTIFGRPHSRGGFCDGVSRRDFLRAGTLALGGLTLADLLRLKAQGAVDMDDWSLLRSVTKSEEPTGIGAHRLEQLSVERNVDGVMPVFANMMCD